MCYFFKYYKSDNPDLRWLILSIKHWITLSIISIIVVIPWLIRNYFIVSASISGVVGYQSFFQTADQTLIQIASFADPSNSLIGGTLNSGGIEYNIVVDLIIQVVIHHGFILLASGIIFFIISLMLFYKSFKTKDGTNHTT